MDTVKSEIDDIILSELVKEGYTGEELIQVFRNKQAGIRPAVERMLEEAKLAAAGKSKSYTIDEIFGD